MEMGGSDFISPSMAFFASWEIKFGNVFFFLTASLSSSDYWLFFLFLTFVSLLFQRLFLREWLNLRCGRGCGHDLKFQDSNRFQGRVVKSQENLSSYTFAHDDWRKVFWNIRTGGCPIGNLSGVQFWTWTWTWAWGWKIKELMLFLFHVRSRWKKKNGKNCFFSFFPDQKINLIFFSFFFFFWGNKNAIQEFWTQPQNK